MSNRTTLTKSLHTVTVVSRVAVHMYPDTCDNDPALAVCNVLAVLGLPCDYPETDLTFAACVAKVRALRGGK